MNTTTMPTLFIAHGGPPLAVDPVAGEDFRVWGKSLPKPKAILVFSAHWQGRDPIAIGETSEHNELIYDFAGFQPELYQLQYRAPGAAWLVEPVAELLGRQDNVLLTERGLDHGVWVPFIHLWPQADVPILQLSMPYTFSDKALFELGEQLSPLRKQGVVIVGSGGLTHNLRQVNWQHQGPPYSWAVEFDQWVAETLSSYNYDALLNWQSVAPQAKMNHPTPEHFRPVLIAAGAAQNELLSFPIDGFELGSISRRSVQF
ncbi:DODA-type extradiol aromatic ring-opening family dioxygenase, partial [Kaarinaea lacus]